MASDDEILTVKEVGEILQVHPSTIYKLTRQGKIPAFKVGSDWRFRKDVIERWIGDEAIAFERLLDPLPSPSIWPPCWPV